MLCTSVTGCAWLYIGPTCKVSGHTQECRHWLITPNASRPEGIHPWSASMVSKITVVMFNAVLWPSSAWQLLFMLLVSGTGRGVRVGPCE